MRCRHVCVMGLLIVRICRMKGLVRIVLRGLCIVGVGGTVLRGVRGVMEGGIAQMGVMSEPVVSIQKIFLKIRFWFFTIFIDICKKLKCKGIFS